MVISNIQAVSLGVVEREATENKRAWTALDFVILNENSSRRVFIDRKDAELLSAVRSMCSTWGESFQLSGEVDASGRVSISSVAPCDEDIFNIGG